MLQLSRHSDCHIGVSGNPVDDQSSSSLFSFSAMAKTSCHRLGTTRSTRIS
jgi:hypothetical protein